MRVHERFQLVSLFQLFRGRQSLLLLLLVKHHLFHDRTSFVVQVTKLAILWLDLLGVDLFVALNDAVPPVLALFLRQIQLQNLAAFVVCLNAPRRVLKFDWLVPVTLN